MITKLFPIILMLLDLAAGCAYLVKGNYWCAFYWILAAGLTLCAINMRS